MFGGWQNRARLRGQLRGLGKRASPLRATGKLWQAPWQKTSLLGLSLSAMSPLRRIASLGFLEQQRQMLDTRIGLLGQRLNALKSIRNNIAGATGDFEGPLNDAYVGVEGEVAAGTGSSGTGTNGTATPGVSARMWDEIFEKTRRRTKHGYPFDDDVQDQLEDRDLDPVPESVWQPEFDAYLHRKEAREHEEHHEHREHHEHEHLEHEHHEHHENGEHKKKPDRAEYATLFKRIASNPHSDYLNDDGSLSLRHVEGWLDRNRLAYNRNSVLDAWADFQASRKKKPRKKTTR
jgi:hypothetical protein